MFNSSESFLDLQLLPHMFFHPVFFVPSRISVMQYFWKECSIRVLGFFSQAMDTNSASCDAHVQVKTTMSQLPPGNSKLKIHSDFRGVKMLKILKRKRKKGKKEKEGRKGKRKGS